MFWAYTMNIRILLLQMTNTMLSTPWLALEANRRKWNNNKRNNSRHTRRCSKCKWCRTSKCSSSSLTPVVSLLSSSIARCSSNRWICNKLNTTWTLNTETKWCNSSNSHSGQHSSNLLRIKEINLTQEVSATLAHSNPLLKITIRQLQDNTTMDW